MTLNSSLSDKRTEESGGIPPPAADHPKSRTHRLSRILLILMMAGYALFFSAQLMLHYYSFGSRALDLGNHSQAIWNTAQGNWFHQTNQPGATSRLSLHVEPILLPVSLLYRIYPGPEILFVFQSVVVALGAIPVFALARHALKNEWLALLFAAVFLLLPAVQAATLLDFHAVTLAPTFLLAAFYFMETSRSGVTATEIEKERGDTPQSPRPAALFSQESRRPAWFALFAALAVACKEDIILLVMMMGLYALLVNRQRRLGAITMAVTGLWAFVAVFVIPRTFAGTENIHWNRYDHLGDSPLNIVLNMAMQPELFISHLRAVDAVGYFRLLLAPTAYTALLSPLTLLLALPSLGINLLSNFPPMQQVNSLIYAAPVVPAVMISSIYGVRNLKRIIERRGWPRPDPQFSPVFNGVMGGLIALSTLVYHAYFGYLPGGGQFRGWEEVTDHDRLSAEIFAQIPPQAKLSAMDRLNPHVSQRETLYIFDRIDDADHVVLDVTQDSWPLHPLALRLKVDDLLRQGFGIVAADDGYLLLAKDRPELPTELPDAFFDFARVKNVDAFTPQFPAPVVFDDRLALLGYSLQLGAHEQFLPTITLYWRALAPLDEDFSIHPFVMDRSGKIITSADDRPVVSTIWYPTSRWQPGEIIKTSTLPYDLAPNPGDAFTVGVGVSRGNWSNPAERLPITQIYDSLRAFEGKTWARLGSFERTGRKSYQPVATPPATPQQPRQAQFMKIINLTGADLPAGPLRPGDELPFTLYWRSSAPITVDLTTFVHLLNSQGQMVAQLDWTPQDAWGALPTTAWNPDQPVVDQQSLVLPPNLPPGEYTLALGWYFPPSGERLPVTASDQPLLPGDLLPLDTVVVQP